MEGENIEFLLSSRKKKNGEPSYKLLEGGFIYVFNKYAIGGNRKLWNCEQNYAGFCRARVHTVNEISASQ